jgi:amino acid adenylation domain-containing protein
MNDPVSADAPPDNPDNLIAIVGLAGRFPGARNIREFWKNLAAGTESITHFTEAQLEDSFSDEERRAPNFVKARPLLDDVDQFDADFFGMYAREAELTDPQQRVFLEICWDALESAGCDPRSYGGAIGVFAGCSINTYFLQHVLGDRRTQEEFTSSYQVGCYPALLGAGLDFLATRVSYKLDLKGPSLTLQTACSTSLLAVAQACQSLLLYQADLALAGGVSITFPQKRGFVHQEGGMVSADGHCRTFDAQASGTIFGSGAGVVALKRLEDARADGDFIYAVIRGSGVNNDGAAKVGFTAPSVDAQAAAIEMAHANAGIDAASISYVECHGTATPLGDPIEIAALTKAFRGSCDARQFCAVGSVKSNIGHLDAAAGVVGLIKTALALHHELIPASLHYTSPNPQIDFAATPFYVNAKLSPWPRGAQPRRAGVSAFGVGGTNVHVVLEEAPAQAVRASSARPQLLVLSSRSEAALAIARSNLASALREQPGIELSDVANTLQQGRRAFEHRAFVVATTVEEAVARLAAPASTSNRAKLRPGRVPVAFMFPGQGAQYPNMARDLYEQESEFRRQVQRCTEILRPELGDEFLAVLYPPAGAPDSAAALMSTRFAQPAIFTIEYALAQLWMSWGIQPDAMIGHSVGEFVVAVLAGVMRLEDALPLVALRGRLMQALPGGSMLAVRLPESELRPLLDTQLTIAAINGPALSVASGTHEAIAALEQRLQARGVQSRRLHTSHAFHSAMVDPIIAPLREQLQRLRLSAPQLPYVSCATGTWITDAEATSPQYWSRHARETVRFAAGISTLLAQDPAPVLLEVGPGNVLSTLALQTLQGRAVPVITSLQDAARATSDAVTLLEAAGRLWTHGLQPHWTALGPQSGRHVPLPTYPFERKRFWIEAPPSSRRAAAQISADTQTRSDPSPLAARPKAAASTEVAQDTTAMSDRTDNTRIAELSAAIAAILEELSGNAPPSVTEPINFLEMGYDSLFLTQVAQKIQSQMKVKITFRQLLGDYSSIPALAGFLAEKLPAPAPKAQVVPAAAPRAVATTSSLTGAPAMTGGAGLEGLFRDQLQAMSLLINRQFEMLQGGSATAGTVSRAAPTLTTTPTVSALAPPTSAAATESPTEEQRPSRFQVYNPKQASASSGLAPEHQGHINDLAARYSKRLARSKELTQQYRQVLADPRAASGFRVEWKELVYPVVVERAAGSRLWDVDGNEYVDLVNGYGQTAFGHSPDFVVAAVKEQLERGFAIGPQAELAGKVAALFSEITGNERVTFCNTGSEAVMAAMRVARTVTGREKVVIFNGDYHGQFDEVLVKGVQRPGAPPRSMPIAPGIPAAAVQNMIVLEYATPATLQWVRENAEDLAAVVVEPVQSRHPSLQPYEFLREIRKITEQSGTAFVMDEVVTGFRTHPGGIQALAGIRADLATYGKVVGGGLPIGILAGQARFMDALDGGHWNFGDSSFPEVGVTFFAGTFVRHPLVLAAAWAVLNHIKEHGPKLQERLAQRTATLAGDLNALFARYELTTRIETFSSWFYFNIHNEHPLAALLFHHLRLRGIHIHDGFPCFLTTAHSQADFDLIVAAFDDSLAELSGVGILGKSEAPSAATAAVHGGVLTGLPLTESQTEIWLAAQMGDEASCAFNESVSLRLRGTLNESALQRALTLLFARHDALRAHFTPTGEEMCISAAKAIDLLLVDLTTRTDPEAALAEILLEDAHTAFDLVNGPAARVQLARLSATQHVLIFTAHHIICDGWSFNVIVSELAQIYPALCRGESAQLPHALPFSSYARAQAQRDPAEAEKTERFWLARFQDPIKPLDLPTDRARPALKSYAGASRYRRIDAALYQSLKKTGAKAGNTLFVTLLGAFQILIGRLSGQNEVVVGVPTAGQSLLEDQILVGHGVNFLPIRAAWSDETTITQHLRTLAKHMLDANEFQSYTLGTLVRKLALAREQGRVPLAEIQFNLERLAERLELPGLQLEVTPNSKAHVNFDLFLNVIESNEGLRLDCDYNTDLFDAATIDRWLDCYQGLLEMIVADPAQTVERVTYLSPVQRQRVLLDFNRTEAQFPRDRCLHQLFEAHAGARPQAIAAQFRAQSLSYAALNERSNRLANFLLRRIGDGDGQPQRLIGIAVERTLDMLVAMLATLKAGCAYVPLDPTHPAQRLRHILGNADVAALITDGTVEAELLPAGKPIVHLATDAANIAAAVAEAPKVSITADDLAYVIYTSGSTGLPKGVQITHRAVVNFMTSMAREPGLGADDVLLAVTTISFDIAGLELYLPLSVGARVVIAEREEVIDGFALVKHIETCGATVMQATPATWRLLLEAGFRASKGFKMLCGGEVLSRDLADKLLQGAGVLWNMYGPTETTIWSSCCQVLPAATAVSVGRPIANTQLYVLDRHDQPVIEGIAGQLHIGGEGVARGYHKNLELSAERFISNPFAAGRMYRTGDLARWLPDGTLLVLGRLDHQVKLRGFRIELGEIEAALLRSGKLTAVAVLLREDTPGSPRLVAYFAPVADSAVTPTDLRAVVEQELPDYMIPSAWTKLDKLPMTPNGKLDRAALPTPELTLQSAEEFVAPATPTELRLAEIWAEVLHMPRVGATMDLLRLGADSIQLFQIIARSSRQGIRVTAKQLLQHRTVRSIADLIDKASQSTDSVDAKPNLPTLGQFQRGRRAAANTKQ